MKKLLCLILAVVLLLGFAACGGSSEDGEGGNTADVAVKVEFKAEKYTVDVGDYITFSNLVTVTPEGTELTYTSSDSEIAAIFTPSKGEFEGVAAGEVTITAATKDGKASATCTLSVVGMGTVVGRKDNVGGVINKYYGAVEEPDDTEAKIIIINKNIPEGTDMTNAVTLNYGEVTDSGSAAASYANMNYFVAKTGDPDKCYEFAKVPVGDYVGIIISSRDYTMFKSYDKSEALAEFKSSAIGKYFTDDEAADLVEQFWNREFYIDEFSVVAQETTIFGHKFTPDAE